MNFLFTRPEYLVLLLALPLVVFIHFFALKGIKRKSVKFANFEAINRIKGAEVMSKNLTVLYINLVMLLLIVFAISGISVSRNIDSSDLAFVIALDSSRSMAAQDILPSRFEAAIQAGKDFLNLIPEGAKVGVVSFSSTAIIEQEVTDDHNLVENSLDGIELKLIGGTDIMSSVVTSANLLKGEDAKAIILISDGQANINELQSIVDYADENNIMIHSLGIGTSEGGEDDTGASFRISEDTLQLISERTEGNYYNIVNIEDFYTSLNEIVSVTKKRSVTDLSLHTMIIALVLFVINFILINTRFRTIP